MKKILPILLCCLSAALFIDCTPKEILVSSVTLDRDEVTLTEGETTTLVATVLPVDATDPTLTWSSSNTATATVSAGGVVTAIKAGTATVTAKANNGILANCAVTVEIALTAVTGEATHVSCRNATLGGKVNLPASVPATEVTFGVLYSTESEISISNAIKLEATAAGSDMSFTVNTEILSPATTYHYRSYVLQGSEVTYGEEKTFTTLALSSMIRTLDATDVDVTFATLNATLDLTDCNYDAIEYGFKLAQQNNSDKTFVVDNVSDKAFSYRVENLKRDTQYDVVAYVTLDGRTYRAESKSFTTQSLKASITLGEVKNITELTALCTGQLTIESQGHFGQSIKIYYSDTENTVDGLKANGKSSYTTPYSDGSLSCYLQDLEPATTYYYVIIATLDGAAFATEVKHFTTADFTAEVTTQDAINVQSSTATLSGTLSITSIAYLTREVWFFYSETAATAEVLKSTGTKAAATLSKNTFSADITGLKKGTTYYCIACAKVQGRELYGAVMSFDTPYPVPEAVDMGLSVKWGSFNVGASKPEEYGYYFAWGEMNVKSVYEWSNYTLCGGSGSSMTKYCNNSSYGIVDNKRILEASDDVAARKIGGSWRMPTDAEWTELRNTSKCTWSWTTENGVAGYRVTSKTTGNSIFLPAAGLRYSDYIIPGGSEGHYWSATVSLDEPDNAWRIQFGPSYVDRKYEDRYEGLSVRPVCN